ncbi:hypothetical protein [Leptospira levettii]|uniref:hypothetical protein n=1 Tax=Leptospira levettii TaxID=2023178 RepID=UPI000F63623E|nr:hypothetical protein [Leptospira levettii]
MEENKALTSKPKEPISEKAIRKISNSQFSVFIEVGKAWCFLGRAESRDQAETMYWSQKKK